MTANIVFASLFLFVIWLIAKAIIPRQHVHGREGLQRLRTIQRLYVACKRERYRTLIITKDEQFAVGDGAWHSVRAEYPEVGGV